MTCIAWDGKTLASDGRVTMRDTVMGDDCIKIFTDIDAEVRGSKVVCYASAGSADMIGLLKLWIEDGCPLTAELKECNFECLIITKDNSFTYNSVSNDLYPTADCCALGSGGDWAFSAMRMGRDAKKAVAHGVDLDLFSGGQGRFINCRVKNPKLKTFDI